MDLSGSMSELLDDGTPKHQAVVEALDQLVSGLDGQGSRVAVVSALAVAPPFDYPEIQVSTALPLTEDLGLVSEALAQLPAPDADDGTPAVEALRHAKELLANGPSGRRPLILWVTDGLVTMDGDGHGPTFYSAEEINAISMRRPDDTFRSRGEVAWSGTLNAQIDTYDGEALADTMAELEASRLALPDLRIVTLMPVGEQEPGYPDLPAYASYLTRGEVIDLLDMASIPATVEQLRRALDCGALLLDGFESGDCSAWAVCPSSGP
jgi:hypothetical protein